MIVKNFNSFAFLCDMQEVSYCLTIPAEHNCWSGYVCNKELFLPSSAEGGDVYAELLLAHICRAGLHVT